MMGSPPRGDERKMDFIHDEASSMLPIEMTEIDDHPSVETSQNPPKPPTTDPIHPTSPSLSLTEIKSQAQAPLAADPASVPSREPLVITSTNTDVNPLAAAPYPLTREKTGPAIGPSTDKAPPLPQESETVGPSLLITLLLISGARHPYKIDERYLRKRNVNVDSNNPVNMSVYTLKELIWREWRDDWEIRPSSPSAIRLIYYGKMLEDKSRLHDCRFESGLIPHVVHMTIKPQEIIDEEDAKIAKTGSGDREGNEGSTGCR
ncbi:MAG: hypothetical protein Q9224_005558, partial [Gallowayella concinna]